MMPVHVRSNDSKTANDITFSQKLAENANSQFIFLNAWNEWAEGAYLEPDEKHGYAYLNAIKDLTKDN